MDRSQIISRRHTYLAFICVVLLTFTLLAAGCTGKDASSPVSSSSKESGPVASGSGVQPGDLVEINYTGTLANGSVFDSSKESGPFQFVVGTGSAITGFDNQIQGMTIGQNKKFTLTPDEAYGEYDPANVMIKPISFVPPGENVTVGQSIMLFNGMNYLQVKVTSLNATNVTFDMNHPLAGQSLTFEVSLVNLTPAKEVEKMIQQYQNQTVQLPVVEGNSGAQAPDQKSGSNATGTKSL